MRTVGAQPPRIQQGMPAVPATGGTPASRAQDWAKLSLHENKSRIAFKVHRLVLTPEERPASAEPGPHGEDADSHDAKVIYNHVRLQGSYLLRRQSKPPARPSAFTHPRAAGLGKIVILLVERT